MPEKVPVARDVGFPIPISTDQLSLFTSFEPYAEYLVPRVRRREENPCD